MDFVSGGGKGAVEFAVRLTTGQVKRQEVKNTNRPRG
jgi:hypothetical protein